MINLRRTGRSHNNDMLLSQGVLNVLGSLLSFLVLRSTGIDGLLVPAVLCILSGALTVVSMIAVREAVPDRRASLVFALNLVPVYWMLWMTAASHIGQGQFWVPFQAHGLSSLTIAILAPPGRLLGALEIIVIPVMAAFQYAMLTAAQVSWFPAHPLLPPIVFGLFSLILYFFRRAGISVAELAARKEAEARMMRQLTRAVLAIKDLANSPIQALTVDAEILRRKHPEERAIASRIASSVGRLRELNGILDEHLRERPEGLVEVSFDKREDPNT